MSDTQAKNNEIDSTPFAKWRENNDEDPHSDSYDQDVKFLAYGDFSHEVVAQSLISDPSKILFFTWVMAGKDRLRWLSRKLYSLNKNHQEINRSRATLLLGHLTDDELANKFFLTESMEDLKAGRERILWLNDRIQSIKN